MSTVFDNLELSEILEEASSSLGKKEDLLPLIGQIGHLRTLQFFANSSILNILNHAVA